MGRFATLSLLICCPFAVWYSDIGGQVITTQLRPSTLEQ